MRGMHVLPCDPEGWVVTLEGREEPVSTHSNRGGAVAFAKAYATVHGYSPVAVHAPSGEAPEIIAIVGGEAEHQDA